MTFDSEVRLDMPLERMDNAGRTKAEGIVRRLHPGSTTNLSGGALKAVDVLDASADAEARGKDKQGRTRAVMLFTDGLANQGIRDTPRLVAAVSGALSTASAKCGGPISMFTFGFGADHSEDCLRALATSSGAGGLYYYVNTADDIPNAFADALGGLTSVVAQNATLDLKATGDAGTAVARVLGSTYARDASGALVLGDLFAEDEKDILIELSLPARSAPSDEPVAVLDATLRAFNVVRGAPEVVGVSLAIARPVSTPPNQPPNLQIDAQRNRIEAAEAMEKASQAADRGDLDAGREVLKRARLLISASDSAATEFCSNLVEEFSQQETAYRSVSQYRNYGSKLSKMQAMSHSRQRATHSSAPNMYSAGASRKAAVKSAWMSSLKAGDSDED